MIIQSLKESFGLIGRSRGEVLFYICAVAFGGWLYALSCGMMGIGDPYALEQVMKDEPLKALIAELPGILVVTWFLTGLSGRFIMHAYKGAADRMSVYAKGWYLRKLFVDVFFVVFLLAPAILLSYGPMGAVFAIMWIITAIWLGIRITLWLNISVIRGFPLFESLKRSYSITNGHMLRLLMITGLPMASAKILHQIAVLAVPGNTFADFYLKTVMDGAGLMVGVAAVAAAYVKITTAPAAAAPVSDGEVVPQE